MTMTVDQLVLALEEQLAALRRSGAALAQRGLVDHDGLLASAESAAAVLEKKAFGSPADVAEAGRVLAELKAAIAGFDLQAIAKRALESVANRSARQTNRAHVARAMAASFGRASLDDATRELWQTAFVSACETRRYAAARNAARVLAQDAVANRRFASAARRAAKLSALAEACGHRRESIEHGLEAAIFAAWDGKRAAALAIYSAQVRRSPAASSAGVSRELLVGRRPATQD